MAITYSIENMTRYAASGGVTRVEALASKDKDGVTASHSVWASFNPDSNADGFVPYNELTEAAVIGWVENAVDTVRLNTVLDERLEALLHPVTINGVPWE